MDDPTPKPASFEHSIIDNLSSAVLLFDAHLCLTYINPAGEMLFGGSKRQLLNREVGDLFSCAERAAALHLVEAQESGNPVTEREITLDLPAGEVTVDCTVVPMREPAGALLVELQQVDRQLRIFREEKLVQQHKATRDLVRGLAHEIKNPLGGLRGAAQLLEAELPAPELREYTRVIISEADRLQLLVDRMLGPNKRPVLRKVNIHHVLERVRQLVAAEGGSGLELVADYDPSIPELEGDADQLIQAFLNLVRNAARAVENRGRIELRTRVQRHYTIGNQRFRLVARVDVIDNGPGVSEEMLDRLFYPLVSGTEGGVGLGLSIAQALVQRHNGLIECTSQPGETVFTVLLPLETEK